VEQGQHGTVIPIGKMQNCNIHDPQTVLERTAKQFDALSTLTEDELQAICHAVGDTGIPHAVNRLHAHWTRILIQRLQDDVL